MKWQIKGAVLTKCIPGKNEKQADIPNNVTSIGNNAFRNCTNLSIITVPEGVTNIGEDAFKQCTKLLSISLPESLTSIGSYAFQDCYSLKAVSIPDSIKVIGGHAFHGCAALRQVVIHVMAPSAFNTTKEPTENSDCLEQHANQSGLGMGAFLDCKSLESFVIPHGMQYIDKMAFYRCSGLSSIYIPHGVVSIGDSAFSYCKSLTNVVLPNSMKQIGTWAFKGCNRLSSVDIPHGVERIGAGAFTDCTIIKSVVLPSSLVEMGPNAYPAATRVSLPVMNINAEGAGAAVILERTRAERSATDIAHVILTNSRVKKLLDVLRDYMEGSSPKCTPDDVAEEIIKIMEASEKNKNHAIAAASFSASYADVISKENTNRILELCGDAGFKIKDPSLDDSQMGLAKNNQVKSGFHLSDGKVISAHPIELFIRGKSDYSQMIECIKNARLSSRKKIEVKYAGSSESASIDVINYVLASYMSQMTARPRKTKGFRKDFISTSIHKNADQAAAALDKEDFYTYLTEIALSGLEVEYPQRLLPFCRYASGEQIGKLISNMRNWGKWDMFGARGRSAIIVAQGALLLSDTREAMIYVDKLGLLANYASMRGMDEDSVRDMGIADFGLDMVGKKTYDTGGKIIQVTLKPDLTFSIVDTAEGKEIKSIPKRGGDPSKIASCSADFSAMKKGVRSAALNRTASLKKDFVSGRPKQFLNWKKSYLSNPFLRIFARLVVWEYRNEAGMQWFTLDESGAVIGFDKSPLTLPDEGHVCVAHPVEMIPSGVTSWQEYSVSKQLEQPFEQIWEPVFRLSKKEFAQRYYGCYVPMYYMIDLVKQGYDLFGDPSEGDMYLKGASGFSLGFLYDEATDETRRWQAIPPTALIWLGNAEFSRSASQREFNHTVAVLDRITIFARVMKDDDSIAAILNGFKAPQIDRFLKLAIEHSSTKCTAILLDYKNRHFGMNSGMDEYTLE